MTISNSLMIRLSLSRKQLLRQESGIDPEFPLDRQGISRLLAPHAMLLRWQMERKSLTKPAVNSNPLALWVLWYNSGEAREVF